MIYITGDTHGDYSRFKTRSFKDQATMSKADYVIITGDFGFWSDTPEQNYWLDWLENKSFTTLWVDGNHEHFDLLKEIPIEKWHGGKIQRIRPSVIHLMRGQVFTIDGCKIFTFGGARSHDIDAGILNKEDPDFDFKRRQLDKSRACYRVDHVSWWQEEMPSEEEHIEGIANLAKHDNKIDYIITHDCATNTKILLSKGFYKPDELSDYFQDIKAMVQFKKWYFGHYHDDKAINDQEILCYERINRIW